MNFYKLKIAYNGFPYEGWQKQPHNRPTVQGELESTLRQIFSTQGEQIHTLGSGRTDRGVHALGQVVKLSLTQDVPCDGLIKVLNGKLSKNIRILECEKVEESFHPIIHAHSKEYRYYILPTKNENPFLDPFITFWPYELDLEKLKAGLNLFQGRHDFHNFFTTGTPVKSTVREIYEANLKVGEKEMNPFIPVPEGALCIQFVGEGFLKQMVRCLVGALLNHAKGACELSDISNALESGEKQRVGVVAPSNGLYLYQVNYS